MEYNQFIDIFWLPSLVAFATLVVVVKAKQYKKGIALQQFILYFKSSPLLVSNPVKNCGKLDWERGQIRGYCTDNRAAPERL